MQRIVGGVPTVLVHDGRFQHRNMNRERVPASEIFSEMRKAGVAELSGVRWAILEPDGKISIVPANPADTASVSK